MSENLKIEPEELRFIYRLILDGRSDSDILNEYATFSDIGKLNFPLRTDDNFIKDRRLEMEIASEVLKDSILKIVRPFLLMQQEKHLAQIIEISTALLQNNLASVVKSSGEAIYGFRSKGAYISGYTIRDSHNIPIQLSRLQLVNMFRKNVEEVCERFTYTFFYDCYVPHLKAEMPEMEAEGLWPQIEKEPYEVIKAIKQLAKSKGLQGICPLCSDLESQLPPLIRFTDNDVQRSAIILSV